MNKTEDFIREILESRIKEKIQVENEIEKHEKSKDKLTHESDKLLEHRDEHAVAATHLRTLNEQTNETIGKLANNLGLNENDIQSIKNKFIEVQKENEKIREEEISKES